VNRNPLAAHPQWRQLLIVTVALPAAVVLALLVFAWPSARIEPRDLPIGLIGINPVAQQVLSGLDRTEPGGFDVRLYADVHAARTAIERRTIYGALDVSDGRVTVYDAAAAGPTVAQVLTGVGAHLAEAHNPAGQVRVVDVVPLSSRDPRGAVLTSAVLPLTICSLLVGAVLGLVLRLESLWLHLSAFVLVSASVGLGAYLIAQGYLGALPHEPLATWGALALAVLAMCATAGGLAELTGAAGLGVSGLLLVLLGNAFSATTSAPELLPKAVGQLGQWLPPGAAANLLRSTAYFDGQGAGGHAAVLVLWTVFGAAAIVIARRRAARAGAIGRHEAAGASGTPEDHDELIPDASAGGPVLVPLRP
jgi:hypothetical protein